MEKTEKKSLEWLNLATIIMTTDQIKIINNFLKRISKTLMIFFPSKVLFREETTMNQQFEYLK